MERAVAFIPCLCGFSGACSWLWQETGCWARWMSTSQQLLDDESVKQREVDLKLTLESLKKKLNRVCKNMILANASFIIVFSSNTVRECSSDQQIQSRCPLQTIQFCFCS